MGRKKRLITKSTPNVISQYELMQKAKSFGEDFAKSSMLFKAMEVLKLDFQMEEEAEEVKRPLKKPPKIPNKKKTKKTSKKKGKVSPSDPKVESEPELKLILGEDDSTSSESEDEVESPAQETTISDETDVLSDEPKTLVESDTVSQTEEATDIEAMAGSDIGLESSEEAELETNSKTDDSEEISEVQGGVSDFASSDSHNSEEESTELKTEKAKPNADTKKEILLSNLFALNKKTKNFILGDDVYHKMGIEDFFDFLDEISSPDYIPVFWFFEHDLLVLDSKKEYSVLARHLIKFMAEDENNTYTCLVQGNKPSGRKLADFCSENHITCVTGKYDDILECRLHSAKVIIPEFFKKKFPNPLKGDKVVGFDSSAAFMKESAINELLSDAKTLILSSIQATELVNPNIYLLKVCAYYGQIRGAKRVASNPPDKDIVQFYKTNPVDIVYTFDSGFRMFAKFANVPCQLIKKFIQFTPSDISKKINSIFSRGFNEEGLEDCDRIVFDTLADSFDGKMRFYSQNEDFNGIVTIFRNSHKMKFTVHYIDLINGDIIVVRKNKKALVAEVTNSKNCVGKIRFFGEEAELPRKFPNYSKI